MSEPVEKKLTKGRLILIVVVLIAVGAGVSYAFPPLGILILGAGAVALVGTVFALVRQTRVGQPIKLDETVPTFFTTMGSAFLVLLAAAIAFFATCLPIGLFGTNGEGGNPLDDKRILIAYIAGGVSAVVAGGAVAYFLNRNRRARSSRKHPVSDAGDPPI